MDIFSAEVRTRMSTGGISDSSDLRFESGRGDEHTVELGVRLITSAATREWGVRRGGEAAPYLNNFKFKISYFKRRKKG
jgi:hypothetical protein